MKKSLGVIGILLLVSFSGCVTPVGPKVTRIPFPLEELEKLPKTGTASVIGQGFLKTRSGDVKFAAGNKVTLVPVTAYSNQWYEIQIVQDRRLESADPRYPNYYWQQTADGEGRFEFKDLPAGEYYINTYVFWEAGSTNQGGWIAKKITLKENEELRVILTR
jgi:hypothetical protein